VIDGDYTSLKINPGEIDVTNLPELKVSPTETTEYTLTAENFGSASFATVTVTIGETGNELLVFEWDGEVGKDQLGFARHEPPTENGNWIEPVNYAKGTFYFYALIRDMPVDHEMQLQYCVWQGLQKAEACANRERIKVEDFGTAITWSDPVDEITHHPTKPEKINWAEPRTRDAIAIKNKGGQPVIPSNDPPWGGEDPDEWFPLDWHIMVVVVEEGKVFSGWENYVTPTP
jgi:hypothetical protein